MAKLYTKDNRIQRSWKRCSRFSVFSMRFGYMLFGATLTVAAFFFAERNAFYLYTAVPLLLLAVVFQLTSVLTARQAAVLSAGVIGENATRQLVRHLPGNYTAVSNVRIQHDGKTSELDMVVVGPTGVFVIETKNYTGQITGRTEDENWKRVKRTESGQSYSSTFYSPIKQVATHAYRLSQFLKSNKLYVWVQGVVYFSDASITLKLNGNTKKIPVFRAESKTPYKKNRLLQYIRTFRPQRKLSARTVERIVRLLRA